MAYIKKADAEKQFVQEILNAGGIESYYEMYEHGNYYYCFDLKNGTRRYWTNLSEKSAEIFPVFRVKQWLDHIEQQPSDETIKYLECNNIDVQEFIKTMKKQPLQVAQPNSMQLMTNKPTSGDCVSRQATLDAIIKELCIKDESYLLQSEKTIYNVVKNMLPVTPTQRWIPVSERLPEPDEDVLVTNGKGMYIGWIDPTDKCWRVDSTGEYFMNDIVAWQPLPKAYEEKRGDSDGSN